MYFSWYSLWFHLVSLQEIFFFLNKKKKKRKIASILIEYTYQKFCFLWTVQMDEGLKECDCWHSRYSIKFLLTTKYGTENFFPFVWWVIWRAPRKKQKQKPTLAPYKHTLTSEVKAVIFCITSNPILASRSNKKLYLEGREKHCFQIVFNFSHCFWYY